MDRPLPGALAWWQVATVLLLWTALQPARAESEQTACGLALYQYLQTAWPLQANQTTASFATSLDSFIAADYRCGCSPDMSPMLITWMQYPAWSSALNLQWLANVRGTPEARVLLSNKAFDVPRHLPSLSVMSSGDSLHDYALAQASNQYILQTWDMSGYTTDTLLTSDNLKEMFVPENAALNASSPLGPLHPRTYLLMWYRADALAALGSTRPPRDWDELLDLLQAHAQAARQTQQQRQADGSGGSSLPQWGLCVTGTIDGGRVGDLLAAIAASIVQYTGTSQGYWFSVPQTPDWGLQPLVNSTGWQHAVGVLAQLLAHNAPDAKAGANSTGLDAALERWPAVSPHFLNGSCMVTFEVDAALPYMMRSEALQRPGVLGVAPLPGSRVVMDRGGAVSGSSSSSGVLRTCTAALCGLSTGHDALYLQHLEPEPAQAEELPLPLLNRAPYSAMWMGGQDVDYEHAGQLVYDIVQLTKNLWAVVTAQRKLRQGATDAARAALGYVRLADGTWPADTYASTPWERMAAGPFNVSGYEQELGMGADAAQAYLRVVWHGLHHPNAAPDVSSPEVVNWFRWALTQAAAGLADAVRNATAGGGGSSETAPAVAAAAANASSELARGVQYAMGAYSGGSHAIQKAYMESIGATFNPQHMGSPGGSAGTGGDGSMDPGLIAAAVVVPLVAAALLAATIVFVVLRQRRRHRDLLGRVRAPRPGPDTTLLVSDVQNSTVLWEVVPTAAMEEALRLHHDTFRRLMPKHNAYESATEGDSFILAFACPRNACAFAAACQLALLEQPWPPELLAHPDAAVLLVEPNTGSQLKAAQAQTGAGASPLASGLQPHLMQSAFSSAGGGTGASGGGALSRLARMLNLSLSGSTPSSGADSGAAERLPGGPHHHPYAAPGSPSHPGHVQGQAQDELAVTTSHMDLKHLVSGSQAPASPAGPDHQGGDGGGGGDGSGRYALWDDVSHHHGRLTGDATTAAGSPSGATGGSSGEVAGGASWWPGASNSWGRALEAKYPAVAPEVAAQAAGSPRFNAAAQAQGGAQAPPAAANGQQASTGKCRPLLSFKCPHSQSPAAVAVFRGLRVRMGLHSGLDNPQHMMFNKVASAFKYYGPFAETAKAVSDTVPGGMVVLSAAAFARLRNTARGGQQALAGVVLVYAGHHALAEEHAASPRSPPCSGSQVLTLGADAGDAMVCACEAAATAAVAEEGMALYLALPRPVAGRIAHVAPLRSVRQLQLGNCAAPTGIVTIAFMKVVGAQALVADIPGVAACALATFQRLACRLLCASGGYLLEGGDGLVLAAFGAPPAGVQWALDCVEQLKEQAWAAELVAHELCEEVATYAPAPTPGPPGVESSARPGPLTPTAAADAPPNSGAGGAACGARKVCVADVAAARQVLYRGLRIKVGLDVGPASHALGATSGRLEYRGKVMNRAARITGCAAAGQVVCSAGVWRAVEACGGLADASSHVVGLSLGPVALKGVPGGVECVQCVRQRLGVSTLAATLSGSLQLPLGQASSSRRMLALAQEQEPPQM